VRVIGLSTSLANAKDVGDWIGAPSQSVFNFAPDVRPVPLDLHMLTYDTNHASSRLLAMAKPAFSGITKQSTGKPVLIFVPSRKQAQLTAIDMVAFAAASGEPGRFIGPAGQGGALNSLAESLHDKTVSQTVAQGVGFLYAGMSSSDRAKVEGLFAEGVILVLVVPHSICWSVRASAHMVVVMDTVYYEGREHRYVDYPITDILRMIGRASRQSLDSSAKCLVLCHSPKREYLRKLLHEPLPIESHLDHFLHDHLNAEIVTKTIENKPDAVDYLTWTFYYRRLTQNPNYYNLQGATHRHLSDHLSELVESTIADLEESKCLAVEDDVDVSPLNLGMIASYYYIEYTTIELFASSITAKTKVKGVIEILAAASEFARLTIRNGEEQALQRISKHVPNALPAEVKWEDPATKALVLLQAHFSRFTLSNDLSADLAIILGECIKLLQALVDVISSYGWLRPALAAMEVSQMSVQGLWDKDNILMQIPHFDQRIIAELEQLSTPVTTVFDVLDMDEDVRNDVLQMSPAQLSDVAMFCNAYPNIEVAYELGVDGDVTAGDSVSIKISLSREGDEEDEEDSSTGVVVCPRYPASKREGWWLVIGDPSSNNLLAIKRIALAHDAAVSLFAFAFYARLCYPFSTLSLQVKLDFPAPEMPGDYNMVLYVMCDSYLGCDQEYKFNLTVVPGDDNDEDA
jgi:pre-mRNA-splicing helicase BRR2